MCTCVPFFKEESGSHSWNLPTLETGLRFCVTCGERKLSDGGRVLTLVERTRACFRLYTYAERRGACSLLPCGRYLFWSARWHTTTLAKAFPVLLRHQNLAKKCSPTEMNDDTALFGHVICSSVQ